MIEVRSLYLGEEVGAAINFLDSIFADNPGWLANRSSVADAVKADPQLAVVAFESEKLIGVVVFDKSGVIKSIGVDVNQRRRGLGRSLLKAVEQAARSKGCRRLTLGSVDDATDFYLACGYSATLLIQFRSGESGLDIRAKRLAMDLLKSYTIKRVEWEGSPQLFVQTGGVDWDLKYKVEEFDPGTVCQYIMGKTL